MSANKGGSMRCFTGLAAPRGQVTLHCAYGKSGATRRIAREHALRRRRTTKLRT